MNVTLGLTIAPALFTRADEVIGLHSRVKRTSMLKALASAFDPSATTSGAIAASALVTAIQKMHPLHSPTKWCLVRVLVIFAHPLGDSYAATLRDTAVAALKASGHTIDLCDLYQEGFDPVLSAQEWRDYRNTSENTRTVARHVERLRQAEGTIFVFPSWWYGMPAILKGYFDRVWLPGVAFEFGPQAIRPLLGSIRMFGVVTTTGAPEWFTRFYMGNPSRKVLMRGLSRLLVAPGAERFWLALYGMENATDVKRTAFIEQVRKRISNIRA